MNASSKRYSGYVPVTLSGTVLLASLLYNLFVFSALASHPQVGTALRNAIRNDAPIVSIYVLVGDLVRVGPLATLGDASAAEIAGPIAEKIRSYPPGAVDLCTRFHQRGGRAWLPHRRWNGRRLFECPSHGKPARYVGRSLLDWR